MLDGKSKSRYPSLHDSFNGEGCGWLCILCAGIHYRKGVKYPFRGIRHLGCNLSITRIEPTRIFLSCSDLPESDLRVLRQLPTFVLYSNLHYDHILGYANNASSRVVWADVRLRNNDPPPLIPTGLLTAKADDSAQQGLKK